MVRVMYESVVYKILQFDALLLHFIWGLSCVSLGIDAVVRRNGTKHAYCDAKFYVAIWLCWNYAMF